MFHLPCGSIAHPYHYLHNICNKFFKGTTCMWGKHLHIKLLFTKKPIIWQYLKKTQNNNFLAANFCESSHSPSSEMRCCDTRILRSSILTSPHSFQQLSGSTDAACKASWLVLGKYKGKKPQVDFWLVVSTNPSEKYARQSWIISPSRGENKKIFETTNQTWKQPNGWSP